MGEHILVIDEGTTSTRAMAFDRDFEEVASTQAEIALSFPQAGWVEQDGKAIWRDTLAVCQDVIDMIGGATSVAAIAIANQRETTLLWERVSGEPIAPAIVWQDRRTAATCDHLRAGGHEPAVTSTTGLLLDPYFSATKLAARLPRAPDPTKFAFGTIDTWLIWNLTGGARHVTDVTNASRTLLMELEAGAWSAKMCALFGVPEAVLPQILPSAAAFGETDPTLFGRPIPILAAIGDQQAALVGQGCLRPGRAKITLGTGAFLVANTGETRPQSTNRLLATKGYAFSGGAEAFALEGSIFNAGTVVKWLRDELGLIAAAADTEAMAASLESNGGVYFVPAFTGLGAPHWNAEATGLITGLTRGITAAHIVRAGLEAVAYQTHDLLGAFAADGAPVDLLRVDGGMAANDWLMQFMADICACPVERPAYPEMTALGAAACAGFQLGWTDPERWAARRGAYDRFEPRATAGTRARCLAGWRAAIGQALQR